MTQDASSLTEPLNNNEYTAEDIQVLGGREAIRRRPGMYIGSTDQRGLLHLVYEIAYNYPASLLSDRSYPGFTVPTLPPDSSFLFCPHCQQGGKD